MTDDYVPRPEFERVVRDHERRLSGHDSLYGDLRQAREELVRFVETLRMVQKELQAGGVQQAQCRAECKSHREGFDKRLRALEKFRWQIGGALLLVSVAVPIALRFI